MKKHKLEGYCIRGDEDIAERIRKVFEADGYNWGPERVLSGKYHCGHKPSEYACVQDYFTELGILTKYKEITIDQAERIVFGEQSDELNVGMKVVSHKDYSWLKKGEIYEIKLLEGGLLKLIPEGSTNSEISADTSWLQYLRRATITDFLRTLPEDIAERALRQVDEEYVDYLVHPQNIGDAIDCFADWDETNEGWYYWNEVSRGNYDRAREILSEKQPEKTFPRMMWVGDYNDHAKIPRKVIAICDWREKPYVYESPNGRHICEAREGCDIHPLTGEPAEIQPEPSTEITDEVMIKAVERLCEMLGRKYGELESITACDDYSGGIMSETDKVLFQFKSIPELIKHLRDEK